MVLPVGAWEQQRRLTVSAEQLFFQSNFCDRRATTQEVFLVDGAGRVRGKAYCMKKERVPAQLCKRCKGAKVCEKGGMILWQEK